MATDAMCMLLAINTSSITLIPVTVIALLTAGHSRNPTVIIGTSLAATAVAHAFAIGACKLLERTKWYRLPRLDSAPAGAAAGPEPESTSAAATEGAKVQEQASRADAGLPWVPGSKWILAALAGIFIGMVLGYAFPEWTGRAPGADQVAQGWLLRVVSALSLLLLPWLILFFRFMPYCGAFRSTRNRRGWQGGVPGFPAHSSLCRRDAGGGGHVRARRAGWTCCHGCCGR